MGALHIITYSSPIEDTPLQLTSCRQTKSSFEFFFICFLYSHKSLSVFEQNTCRADVYSGIIAILKKSVTYQ